MPEVRLSRLDLDPAQPLRRIPPRPPKYRQPGYDAAFDYQTVFYDCFTPADGRSLLCIGPPLANLAGTVVPELVRAFDSRERANVRRLDRVSELSFRPGLAVAELTAGLFAQRTLTVQPNHCEWFRGRRVLMTKSKDNHISWIRDWAEFYARHHRCDAVLFYDNGSTQYESEKVREVLRGIPGVEVSVVVDWLFPYGPQGAPGWGWAWLGRTGLVHYLWDSDFSQYGVLEHAHHRFLSSASAVVSLDIDELAITAHHESIFDLVQRSRTGYLRFDSVWVENAAANDAGEARRHRDYIYRRTPKPRPASKKWALVPSRCPPQSQWCVHLVTGMKRDRAASSHVTLRHFAAISTNWKSRRWVPERPGPTHEVDQELLGWMR